MVFYVITGNLIAALRRTDDFWSGDHALWLGEGRDEILRWHAEYRETSLGEVQSAASTEDALWMVRTVYIMDGVTCKHP